VRVAQLENKAAVKTKPAVRAAVIRFPEMGVAMLFHPREAA